MIEMSKSFGIFMWDHGVRQSEGWSLWRPSRTPRLVTPQLHNPVTIDQIWSLPRHLVF